MPIEVAWRGQYKKPVEGIDVSYQMSQIQLWDSFVLNQPQVLARLSAGNVQHAGCPSARNDSCEELMRFDFEEFSRDPGPFSIVTASGFGANIDASPFGRLYGEVSYSYWKYQHCQWWFRNSVGQSNLESIF
jgi:hypothetical protein